MVDVDRFVRRAYETVLGRQASDAEAGVVAQALAAGLDPLDYLSSLLESGEAKAARRASSVEQASDMFEDEPFALLAERYAEFSMTSIGNLYAAFDACRYVANAAVPGDIVECGVWRGGIAAIMAATLLHFEAPRRNVWLYDTFTGMPRPDANDVRHDGVPAVPIWQGVADADGWHQASKDDVAKVIASTRYPDAMTRLIEGRVEDTIPSSAPDEIAVLRLDTDWYESTRHELEQLWPRLSSGGVLIIDDYGWWRGARRAVAEFFTNEPVLLARVDAAGSRLVVKR